MGKKTIDRLTATELEYWLRKREYRLPRYEITHEEMKSKEYREMENTNRILGRSFYHTFSKWVAQFGRIPTPQEFVAMQLRDVKKCYESTAWRKNNNVRFKWSDLIERGIKNRILRSYKSFIVELHTELKIQELFPKLEILRGDELDYSGIDILLYDKKAKIYHPIHVTKNSEYSIDYLFKKEGKSLTFKGYGTKMYARPIWSEREHRLYSTRDFTGDLFFLYEEFSSSEVCKYMNGYPLFRDEYIKNKIEVSTRLKTGA